MSMITYVCILCISVCFCVYIIGGYVEIYVCMHMSVSMCACVYTHATCEHVWCWGLAVSLGVCLSLSVHVKGVKSQARFGMQN